MQYQKNNKPTKAVILAAGFGSRLRPITDTTPKALVEVAGKPMLLRNIELVKSLGIKDVIINTHYLADQINDFCRNIEDTNITLVHEPEILETGGGILNIMSTIANEPLLVVNSDVVLQSNNAHPLSELVNSWDSQNMELLALLEQNRTQYKRSNGDFNLSNTGKLLNEGEKKDYIFMGAYIISPEFFKGYNVHKFRVPEIIFKANGEDHKFFGIENTSTWFDIGSKESLEVANKYLKENEAKAN